MIIQTVRAWTDFMNDATNGINAQLRLIQTDVTDPIVPNVLSIVDATRDVRASQGEPPINTPAIQVYPLFNQVLHPYINPAGGIRKGEVTVVMNYHLQKSDSVNGLIWALYTQQAIEKTLGLFISNANIPSRTRNNIGINGITKLEHQPNIVSGTDTTIVLSTIIGFEVRDGNP